jgi:hypothetical protein
MQCGQKSNHLSGACCKTSSCSYYLMIFFVHAYYYQNEEEEEEHKSSVTIKLSICWCTSHVHFHPLGRGSKLRVRVKRNSIIKHSCRHECIEV